MVVNPIEVARVSMPSAEMLEAESPHWRRAIERELKLEPAPVAMVAAVSPMVARGRGHGAVRRIFVRMLHNTEALGIRLSWQDESADVEVGDLDRFVDAAAVMFPLVPGAPSLTMGDAAKPVNAWYWRADREEPFDVVARGYATSQRRPGRASSLAAIGQHAHGRWTVLFRRPLRVGAVDTVVFEPGTDSEVAFAVWEGSNAERSAQKSVSGAFLRARLAA